MNFPIIMSLWLMRQGLDDDTDTDMTNASALESAAFALCCIVAAAILCVASACAWDLLSDFYFFLNDSMALLAAYIIFLFVSVTSVAAWDTDGTSLMCRPMTGPRASTASHLREHRRVGSTSTIFKEGFKKWQITEFVFGCPHLWYS